MMAKRFSKILLAVSLLALGGCEAVALGVATPMVIQQKRVNLLNSSYAAADVLAQQTGKKMPKSMPLMVSELQEIIDVNKQGAKPSPKLGQVISQQIQTRFAQLGYNIVDAPRSLLKLNASAPVYEKWLRASLEVQYVGDRLDSAGESLGDYWVANFTLRAIHVWRRWDLSLSVYNIGESRWQDSTYFTTRIQSAPGSVVARATFDF